MNYVEQLGAEAAKLAQLASDAPKVMEQAMLLTSDEAALFLMVRTAMLWLDALPPSEIAAGATGFLVWLCQFSRKGTVLFKLRAAYSK